MFKSYRKSNMTSAAKTGKRYCSYAFGNNNIIISADMVLCLSAVLLSGVIVVDDRIVASSVIIAICLVLRLCLKTKNNKCALKEV